MILEFSFTLLNDHFCLDKILLRILKKYSIEYCIVQTSNKLSLFISTTTKIVQDFAQDLSIEVPHSIFLKDVNVTKVASFPQKQYDLKKRKKKILPFCLQCLKEVTNKNHQNYYNPFTSCEVCGYGVKADKLRSAKKYEMLFSKAALDILNGKSVTLWTLYGVFSVGKVDKAPNSDYDIISYDLKTVKEFTHAKKEELLALGCIEKPLIKLQTNLAFKTKFETVKKNLMKFKLTDDFITYLLLKKLSKLDINLIYISKFIKNDQSKLRLSSSFSKIKKLEILVSPKHMIIVDLQYPYSSLKKSNDREFLGASNLVIKENSLFKQKVFGINISKHYENNCLYLSQETKIVKYLSLQTKANSIKEIIEMIKIQYSATLLKNYQQKFPTLYDRALEVKFSKNSLNIYELWGVIAILLGFSSSTNLIKAATIIENHANSFLGLKGPRVDYKIIKNEKKNLFNPIATIASAMSYKLAGVDDTLLSYGIVQSFIEFLSLECDKVDKNMQNVAIAISGSLLEIRPLFYQLSMTISKRHKLYFNKALAVDGENITYGK